MERLAEGRIVASYLAVEPWRCVLSGSGVEVIPLDVYLTFVV